MFNADQIEKKSDSLIELLAAQCADLEKLLALARNETAAAEQGNFETILEIVSERAEISRRLETFQLQIANFRESLQAVEATLLQNKAAARVVEIATLTLAQDQKTKRLLTAARTEAAEELQKLDKSQRGANAYLQGGNKGLAYNRNF